MSQNFSKMSDIYIPELMELDSYWQKAVEDAICDTLKGEKRLYYALKNRKKIKEKLELLGLKTAKTQLSFLTLSQMRMRSQIRVGSPEDKELSVSSSETSEEDVSKALRPPSKRSKSGEKGKTAEKRAKSPERPLLGSGSLEKMKKSQNSFNCEPMGFDKRDPELSDSDNEDGMGEMGVPMDDDQNKTVEWLHVRNDSDFELSDSESMSNSRENELIEEKDFEKPTTVKEKNYFINKEESSRIKIGTQAARSLSEDSQWGTSSDETIGGDPDLERRLQLALAKRDILNENLNATSLGNNRTEIEVQESRASGVRYAEKRKKGGSLLSPFIRFYLEVYRELCQKCSLKEIAREAARRWWSLSPKEKEVYGETKSSKSSI